MRPVRGFILLATISLLFTLPLTFPSSARAEQTVPIPRAETEQTKDTTPPHPLPAPVTTTHTLDLPGRSLNFQAIAGAIKLSDAQSGTPEADIGFTAFLLNGQEASQRPIVLVFNGGPGASSGWLNLGALGPWRLKADAPLLAPSQPPMLVPNAETWLDFADLVFFDPPGTGYSRLYGKDDEARRSFFSVNGDISALSVAIRKWLAEHDRLASPKFIVGESYGGFRAPKLARRLQETEGIGVSGLIMISPVLDFSWFEGANNPLIAVARLPSLTATARGLDGGASRADLADVEAYASGPYLVDLLRGERDPAALDRLAAKVSAFTKLDPTLVRRLGGRIDLATLSRERKRDEGKVASLYDARILGYDPDPHQASSDYADPILDALRAPLASAMADLIAHRLNWPIEARYEILNDNVNRQWNWNPDRGHAHAQAESLSDLKHVMALDPRLRVLVIHGLSDIVTPYFASKLLLDQVAPMGDPDRLRLSVYPGGHMLYLEETSRAKLREDAAKLITGP
ncbi:S10 family peptidase [Beijerinckia indica]|uniref:Peptidase S10 serine carboxypeptidase n=1 Tax=Beijerinckia indica subsp. indica (strain ATCC 9039 / DSM 1715 / NCIMB 8712) TaxID=395963 RepID=B2IEF6_BEII9|nr:peptidase S10 [Beijerinckia indica]ACB95554.1 peptidase S10 serine carboxypeptidase [Beijerinckia indica subsp. indica ATCC 9039]